MLGRSDTNSNLVQGSLSKILCLTLLICFGSTSYLLADQLAQEAKESYYNQRQSIVSPASMLDIIGFENIIWPSMFGISQTNKLNARFDCFGTFGGQAIFDDNQPAWPNVGFEAPPGSGIGFVYFGEMWVGGIVDGDTLVSDGPFSNNSREFLPDAGFQEGTIWPISGYPGLSMRASFTDTTKSLGHQPLNIKVVNRAHVWNEEPYDRAVVYDLLITNLGDEFISEGFFGLMFDSDVMKFSDANGYKDDFCGSLKDEGIIYSIDADGDPVGGSYNNSESLIQAFGMKILYTSFSPDELNFNWYAFRGNYSYFSPITQAEREAGVSSYDYPSDGSDLDRYKALAYQTWDYDQSAIASIMPELFQTEWVYPNQTDVAEFADGADHKFLLSVGPFDLEPDSSVRIVFTTFLGDSVHHNPNSMSNLPHYPDAYLAELNLENLITTANAAQIIADSLLSPYHPPTGLTFKKIFSDSVQISWDPRVISGIDGVNVTLMSVSVLDWPYPDALPPWQFNANVEEQLLIENTTKVTLKNINSSKRYAVNLSNRYSQIDGHETDDLWLPTNLRFPPAVASSLFLIQGENGQLRWSKPFGYQPASYKLYKFDDSFAARDSYLPFYSLNPAAETLTPVDTIIIDGTSYYYYAMTPVAAVDGSVNLYEAPMTDGECFVLTAVDSFRVQSKLSQIVMVHKILPQTQDILLLTNSHNTYYDVVSRDKIVSFYQEVLGGTNLSWEIKDIASECLNISNCPDWLELTKFKLVIVDDNYLDQLPNVQYEDSESGFGKYLESGGKLAYFGSFSSFVPLSAFNADPRYCHLKHQFIREHFGVDSVFHVGLNHYFRFSATEVDTLFGFTQAEAVLGSSMPTLDCDLSRFPMGTTWETLWPDNTPPLVSAFKLSDRGEVTHRYRSLFPEQSMVEEATIGVRTATSNTETYLFGYHLYYMMPDQARELILSMFNSQSSCCGRFTDGFTGNIDCDHNGTRNLFDIVTLIDHIFLSRTPLCCPGNANVDGSLDGSLNLADIIAMIDHVFLLKAETAACE